VIPIVGQDLLTVSLDGQETLFYPLLARRLAERLDISGADLPPGGELHEVARRYLATSSDVQDIYRQLRAIFRELEPMAVPTPLARLARISQFKLYVTTSFDFLIERAINEARFDCARYWKIAPRVYPRGVMRFKTLDEAREARAKVAKENVRRLKGRTSSSK
jgi:hypothetical protein